MTAKLNGLKIARKIAKKRGGKCLSTKYINNKEKMHWECKQKHRWFAPIRDIKRLDTWCSICSHISITKKRKLNGLNITQRIAKTNSGKCLSTKYTNNYTKMHWECKEKHQWFAPLCTIKDRNSWCPKCARVKKLDGIKIAKQIAKKRGGKCLSTKYINSKEKMHWECKQKHKWMTSLSNIKYNNRWCPECGYLQSAKNSNNSCVLIHWKTKEELVCVASYEKRVVEYLNKNKINFRWQSKTFNMPNGRTYRPDMYLYSSRKWVEIKGYFRKDAKKKWDWFHKYKPNSELWNKDKLKKMKIL